MAVFPYGEVENLAHHLNNQLMKLYTRWPIWNLTVSADPVIVELLMGYGASAQSAYVHVPVNEGAAAFPQPPQGSLCS